MMMINSPEMEMKKLVKSLEMEKQAEETVSCSSLLSLKATLNRRRMDSKVYDGTMPTA